MLPGQGDVGAQLKGDWAPPQWLMPLRSSQKQCDWRRRSKRKCSGAEHSQEHGHANLRADLRANHILYIHVITSVKIIYNNK